MRTYELTLIIDAQLAPETQEEVIAKFLDLLKSQKVEIVNVEKWGKKKLAYPIDDHQYGHYLMTQFNGAVDVIPQIEHYLKLSPHILRYLLLLRDPKTLKLMKLETERRAHEAMISAEKPKDLVNNGEAEVATEENSESNGDTVKPEEENKVDEDI
jgi:small subunit ribosomal protein S6